MADHNYHAASGSAAENLFIDIFADTFGAEKAGMLCTQYHFYDIYNNDRFADFFIENGLHKIAIEVDDEASHNKNIIAENKFCDDLLKQNSMIYLAGTYTAGRSGSFRINLTMSAMNCEYSSELILLFGRLPTIFPPSVEKQ